jgi:GNS1/SUR4 family
MEDFNFQTYNFEEYVSRFPLAKSFYTIPILGIVYLASVAGLMKIMKDKKPLTIIKPVVAVYNLIQIVANFAIVFLALRDKIFVSGSLENLCGHKEQTEYFNSTLVWMGYAWCALKVSDFFDTIFFILLKKFSHVTFLHVYHHFTTMLIAFVVFRFLHTEQAIVYAGVNCLVHMVMYFYYFLTSLGFKPKWKKFVTIFQLVQFFGLMATSIGLLTCQTNPKYLWFSVFSMSQCLMYLYLFGKFYSAAYKKEN